MSGQPSDDATDTARARLQGKRLALVVVIGVAVAFVGASAAQIIPAVFGKRIVPLPTAAPGSDASAVRTCADGIRSLAAALDRARENVQEVPTSPRSDSEPSQRASSVRLRRTPSRALLPEWDRQPAVAQACGASSEGLDAWAALMRLRSAQDQLETRDYAELAPLRRDVAAHLAADLR